VVCNTQNHWVCALCSLSSILNTGQQNISKTGPSSVFRWGEGDTYFLGSTGKTQLSSSLPNLTWRRKQVQFPKCCASIYLEFRTIDKSILTQRIWGIWIPLRLISLRSNYKNILCPVILLRSKEACFKYLWFSTDKKMCNPQYRDLTINITFPLHSNLTFTEWVQSNEYFVHISMLPEI
jgi:hypothetical protein